MAIIIYNFNLGPENRRCRFPRFLSGLATLRSLANFLGAAVSTVIYSHACLQWPGRLFVAPPLFNSTPSPSFVLSSFLPPKHNFRGKRAQKVSDSDRRPQQGHLCFAAGQCYSSCSCFCFWFWACVGICLGPAAQKGHNYTRALCAALFQEFYLPWAK